MLFLSSHKEKILLLVFGFQVRELNQWKIALEEGTLTEEASLAIAKMGNAKCRAAIEAAKASQKVAEREVHIREVVLDDFDVSKALIDYLNYVHHIDNTVVGAPTRNAITRRMTSTGGGWRGSGSNRKVLERSIGREPERSSGRELRIKMAPRATRNNTVNNLSREDLDLLMPRCISRESINRDILLDRDFSRSSMDFQSIDIDSDIDLSSPSHNFTRYRACDEKTKVGAKANHGHVQHAEKQRQPSKSDLTVYEAREINQWKIAEARKLEEARLAEEAALAIAEMEKPKCRAAIEAVEAS
ncbi:hypothetical protein NE237_030214 [Protea cynaroides]|uniref:RING-type E3 ubiquitin transferase n=1 Tax=Protea cynaroides TaxID=273540 RepID=A0A9Q0GWS2_9MAGN|nr:hypothetical protein NE237_030214 [Protea cynaroides]